MILAGQEARADPGGTPARARLARRGLGRSALVTSAYLPVYLPLRTSQQHALARGRSGPGRRRAVRAPVGDAAAPSRCGTRSTGGGRPASRSSSPASSRLRAMGGAAARGTRAAWAARARPWRGASAARDDPARQLPHRPASSGRRVASALIACGEIELALLCAAAHGTLPASGKARCARCARRDGLGAPLGGPAPSRRARPTRRVRADRRQ